MENETASNDSFVDAADLGCPSYSMEAEQQVELFSFWVEGISQVSEQVCIQTGTVKKHFGPRLHELNTAAIGSSNLVSRNQGLTFFSIPVLAR